LLAWNSVAVRLLRVSGPLLTTAAVRLREIVTGRS